ncbi:MAG: L-aspartate oxidase [Actinomycetota bacterium]|nr:L-aspartate oxidase [Actinomycetota bacterium]
MTDRQPASPSRLDVLVVGSGVAGLSTAVRLARLGRARVGVITKGKLEQSTTRWAQGGVAAVLPGDEDSTDLHLADTLRAGAGLCDEAAVRVLVGEGPARVTELISLGADFDRSASGELERAREGGHSMARVLHAGGTATGAEVERALVSAVEQSAAAVFEHSFALDLVVEGGRCRGVRAFMPDGSEQVVAAAEVVLASGGAGQLFSVTTNPAEATGDGIAMALRAGVPVADVEFVQFHPTALHHPLMPRPLLSEALRGHGAVMRDGAGRRFVDELAPRDVVSRAIARRLAETGTDHVFLDCTALPDFARRFPTIDQSLREVGIDPATQWLPIAPAAHYLCGGVLTDLYGATALPGLWAAGEVACTGVHGANRLASNSLLEGMVFGARVVEAIMSGGRDGASGVLDPSAEIPLVALGSCSCARRPVVAPPARSPFVAQAPTAAELLGELQRGLTANAGIVRDAAGLEAASLLLSSTRRAIGERPADSSWAELANLVDVGSALVEAAVAREESRGAHTRADFAATSDRFRVRLRHGGE